MNAIVEILKAIGDTKLGRWGVRHASPIGLTISGALGAGAIASTVVATKRALETIDNEKEARLAKARKKHPEKKIEKEDIHLTKKEVFKITWKYSIVPLTMGACSFAASFGVYKLENRQKLILAGSLGAANARSAALEKELVSRIGQKKTDEIQTDVSRKEEEKSQNEQSNKPKPYLSEDSGMIEMVESFTGQRFYAKPSLLGLAIKDANNAFDRGTDPYDWITMNQWLMLIEANCGVTLERSCVGENMRFPHRHNGESFERDVLRIRYVRGDTIEAVCRIEYAHDSMEWVK